MKKQVIDGKNVLIMTTKWEEKNLRDTSCFSLELKVLSLEEIEHNLWQTERLLDAGDQSKKGNFGTEEAGGMKGKE